MKTFHINGCTVASLYDESTGSFQYVFSDDDTSVAAVIDPVLDFDECAGAIYTTNADEILDYAAQAKLQVSWVLDTHPHADHFSAVPYIATKLGARTGIGAKVCEVQGLWK